MTAADHDDRNDDKAPGLSVRALSAAELGEILDQICDDADQRRRDACHRFQHIMAADDAAPSASSS